MPNGEVRLVAEDEFFGMAEGERFAYIASLENDDERDSYRALLDRKREQRRGIGFQSPSVASVAANKMYQAWMRKKADPAPTHQGTNERRAVVKALIVGVRRVQVRASSSRVVVARNSSSRACVAAASAGGRPSRSADDPAPVGAFFQLAEGWSR